MQSDSESRLDPPPRRDIWGLPRITAVRTVRLRYRTPRRHVVAGEVIEYPEGVEIVVETDGDIPMRALSPALRVGATELAENERTSETSHRFFVLDEETVRAGDPITLGWVGKPAAEAETEFRYEPPVGVIPEPGG